MSEMLLRLPILNELTIDPKFDPRLTNLLRETQENTNLTNLGLGLTPFSGSSDALSQFILKAKCLTTLIISFQDFTQMRSLDSFIEALKGCLNVSTMFLYFSQCERIDNSLAATLTQTLQNLPKLTHLTIQQWSSPSSLKQFMAGPELRILFVGLKTLKNLKKLDLNLSGEKNQVSNQDFILLCESLSGMKQLQILNISLPYVNLEDSGATLLSTIIPELKELNTLSLEFFASKVLSEKSINELTKSITALRFLSNLTLAVKYNKMSFECAKLLMSDFWKIKSLDKIAFILNAFGWDDVQTYLMNSIQQLQMKLQ